MAEPAAGSTFRPHIPFLFYDVIGRMMPGSYLILGAVLCWPAFIQGAVCFLKNSHALGMSGGLAAVLIGTGLILFGFISSFFGFLLAPLSYLVVEQWLWRRSPLNDSDLVKFLGIESASSLNERFKRQFGSERSKNSLNRSSFLCAYYVWQTATALGEMQGRFDSDLLASQSFVLVSLFLFLVLLIEAITEFRIIYLQRKEFRLFPEGADQSGPTAHAAQSAASVSAELSEVLRTEVGQLVLLPVRPEILDRV